MLTLKKVLLAFVGLLISVGEILLAISLPDYAAAILFIGALIYLVLRLYCNRLA